MATSAKRTGGELPRGLDVDEFFDWVVDGAGRYELHDGAVFAMAPERIWHVRVKGAAFLALGNAVREAGVDCRVLTDGAAAVGSGTSPMRSSIAARPQRMMISRLPIR